MSLEDLKLPLKISEQQSQNNFLQRRTNMPVPRGQSCSRRIILSRWCRLSPTQKPNTRTLSGLGLHFQNEDIHCGHSCIIIYGLCIFSSIVENTEKSPFQRFTVVRLRYRNKFHFKRFFYPFTSIIVGLGLTSLYSTEIIEHSVDIEHGMVDETLALSTWDRKSDGHRTSDRVSVYGLRLWSVLTV